MGKKGLLIPGFGFILLVVEAVAALTMHSIAFIALLIFTVIGLLFYVAAALLNRAARDKEKSR